MGLTLKFFRCVVPRPLAVHHESLGGSELSRFSALVEDGEMRVQAGREPAGRGGKHLLHLSAAIGRPGGVASHRRPTDEEMQALREFFAPTDFEDYATDDPHVRHLWEKE